MRAAVAGIILVLALTGATAAPLVLGPAPFRVVDASSATMADALAEARDDRLACTRAGSDCGDTAMTASELAAEGGCDGASATSGWRIAADLKNGSRSADVLEQMIATRALTSCAGGSCLAIVETSGLHETQPDVRSVSVCKVRVVDGAAGPPSDCRDAMKRDANGTVLLRGRVGHSSTSCSMGLRDFDAVFRGRAADIVAVRKTIGDVLRAKPFNLSVVEDGDALVGTRTQLASTVLGGWREWVTVRVDVVARGADAGTSITTTMLVSKQASASRESWTPPSEAQEAAYLLALREVFEQRGGTLSAGLGR